MFEWFIIFILGSIILLYVYLTRDYGYFRLRGVPEVPSKFPFGSWETKQAFMMKMDFMEVMDSIYRQYKELPMIGTVGLSGPNLQIHDLELIRKILVKDFDYFVDKRTLKLDESNEINKHVLHGLTMITGSKWKRIRRLLTPVFTSGKIKAMSHMINQKVVVDFEKFLEEKYLSGGELNASESMVNYTLDAIALCGYGVEANSLTLGEKSQFFRMALKFSGMDSKERANIVLKAILVLLFPRLAKFFNVTLFDMESSKYFIEIIKQSLEMRRNSETKRNDFIDIILKALKKEIDIESIEDQFEKDAQLSDDEDPEIINENDLEFYLVSNLLILFLAGFDTSSNVLQIAIYYLAKNPEAQEKVYDELIEKLNPEEIDNLDYSKINRLNYIDMVVHETLRLYPIAFVERICSKDYKVPGTDFTIPKGMPVRIPSQGIMRNPKYYSNPDEFYPEHFSAENKRERSPYAFLGFGQGPRNCIGMRFALMITKSCLLTIIKNYRIVESVQTPQELKRDPKSVVGKPKDIIWVKLEKR